MYFQEFYVSASFMKHSRIHRKCHSHEIMIVLSNLWCCDFLMLTSAEWLTVYLVCADNKLSRAQYIETEKNKSNSKSSRALW